MARLRRQAGRQRLQPGREGTPAVGDQLAHHEIDRLDLVGALVDHRDARVAHTLLDAPVVRVAVAAEHLQRLAGEREAVVGEEGLEHRRQQRGLLVRALAHGGVGDCSARSIKCAAS
jgi:hypothetical protein